ncbi:hypothetical protein [Sphingopyxis sp. PET50]|uniref:hypothetical protein n=1 Tax=Sphingopyxis sp. PET50 TaxID=2976533 RepID=UPI0021AE3B59|nr:hypothetical protein [Sphingopyxis sp. PET50]
MTPASRGGEDDWIPGQKNDHGVYCPTEVLRMERDKKGWCGVARVEIDLCESSDGWRGSRGFQFFSGDHWGSCSPMTDDGPLHPTREAAIKEQVERLHRDFANLDDPAMQKEAREMLEWADGLVPVQMDMFA